MKRNNMGLIADRRASDELLGASEALRVETLARAERAEAEVRRLRRIFEVLASEDWRGNKPLHVTIAENALKQEHA